MTEAQRKDIKEWRQIPDYPNYLISEYGHVYSLKRKGQYLNPSKNKQGYHHVTLYNEDGQKNFLIHRLVAEVFLGNLTDEQHEVDHRNGDITNNHFTNLRPASRNQQAWNTKMPKTNTSDHKGVSWDKSRQKWRAYIGYHGKKIHLGRFIDYDEACRVRDAKGLELYGDEWITAR